MRINRYRQQRDIVCSAAELEVTRALGRSYGGAEPLTVIEQLKVLASVQARLLSYAYREETAPAQPEEQAADVPLPHGSPWTTKRPNGADHDPGCRWTYPRHPFGCLDDPSAPVHRG